MDASIAIKPVFDRFQTVVITSGVSNNSHFCLYTVIDFLGGRIFSKLLNDSHYIYLQYSKTFDMIVYIF